MALLVGFTNSGLILPSASPSFIPASCDMASAEATQYIQQQIAEEKHSV